MINPVELSNQTVACALSLQNRHLHESLVVNQGPPFEYAHVQCKVWWQNMAGLMYLRAGPCRGVHQPRQMVQRCKLRRRGAAAPLTPHQCSPDVAMDGGQATHDVPLRLCI